MYYNDDYFKEVIYNKKKKKTLNITKRITNRPILILLKKWLMLIYRIIKYIFRWILRWIIWFLVKLILLISWWFFVYFLIEKWYVNI